MQVRRKFEAAVAAMSCLGILACDATGLPEETDLATEAVTQELSGGGVELKTNRIRGTARFTNQNPTILSILNNDPWRFGYASAYSTNPGGFSASTSSVTFNNPQEYTFEMLVEAGARGDSGVIYEVYTRRGWFSFPTLQNVTVRPPSVQPDATQVTVEQCVGVVDITYGTDATCATLANISSASVNEFNIYRNSANHYIGYVPGGFNQNVTINHGVSNGAGGTVYRSNTMKLTVGCDTIVPVCIPVPPPPPPPAKGAITGPGEVIGETSLEGKNLWVFGGPENSSSGVYHASPTSPVGDPSRWWTMSNLPEGSYGMYGRGTLRSGREYMEFYTPYLESWTPAGRVSVVANQTTPVTKAVNGQARYPFVMRPAYFYGSVVLADPYVATHPGARSSLQSLFFSGDYDSNNDGIPNFSVTTGTYIDAGSSSSGSIRSAFPQSFNTTTGELASTYEQPLMSPYDLPLTWSQGSLRLRFWSEGPSFSTRPGLYDPLRFRDGNLSVYPPNTSRPLAPEERARVDHQYCFNEMQLDYSTTLGTFFNPWADVSGSFSGRDWLGRTTSYSVNGTFSGIPAVRGYGNPASYAQANGSIYLSLPQGTYTLRPGANMVNAAGQVNTANFAPINVTLGCGQRLKVVPPLTVAISPLSGCATSASVPVSGVVRSLPAEVDRIWYRVNGGPEVTLCTDCGADPTFSFNVPLQACNNVIQVFAFTEGMPEPATGYQEITWDDPADGPSCAGTYCVNRPPVARCRSVTVAADATCGGANASVNDGSYDPDQGDSVTCAQTPEGPYALGSRRVRLTCTDTSGLSSSCEGTVTVRDTTPPEVTCPASTQLECQEPASFSATATDSCGGTPQVTCSPASGSGLPTGQATVTCTATDAAGNRASCSFPVAVVDTQPPTISCPGAVTAECTGNSSAQVTLPAATAADSCQAPVLTGGGQASYPLGTTQATYTAIDPSGNTAACTSAVTVADTQPPTLELLGAPSVTVGCGDSATQGVVATDVCAGDLSGRVEAVGLDLNRAGTYQVSFRVTDDAGNTTQGLSRTVTVQPPTGTTSMTLLGSSRMTLECGVDTWVDPGATAVNACGQQLVVHRYNSGSDPHGPGPQTSSEGTYSVEYIAWDSSGTTVKALRTVEVDDRIAPALKLNGPAQLTHTCGSAFVDPGAGAEDACYGDLTSRVVASGYVNGWVRGRYTVRYEVRDSANHAAQPVTRTVDVVNCPW
jgi:hypothetical protein